MGINLINNNNGSAGIVAVDISSSPTDIASYMTLGSYSKNNPTTSIFVSKNIGIKTLSPRQQFDVNGNSIVTNIQTSGSDSIHTPYIIGINDMYSTDLTNTVNFGAINNATNLKITNNLISNQSLYLASQSDPQSVPKKVLFTQFNIKKSIFSNTIII